MKRFAANSTTYGLLLLVFLAVLLRLLLFRLNWPVTNADEATMDLEALHIAYQGEHPIFFYGQHYMGTIQAYLGAIMMHLFDVSTFSVRLGTLLLFVLYIVCLYYLISLLYTRTFALICIVLLSLGSDRMMSIPLVANGGYAETMLFGALIFLLACVLAFTSFEKHVGRRRIIRILIYSSLGCTIGLAVWSDQLILPAVLTALLLLLLCCRQDLRRWEGAGMLLGLIVGIVPLIVYNVSAAPGQDSLHVLLSQVFSGSARVIPFWQQLLQALLISLPLATGMPFTAGIHTFCGTVEPYRQVLSSLGSLFPTSNPAVCYTLRGGWAVVIIALWSFALVCVMLSIRRRRRLLKGSPFKAWSLEDKRSQIRLYARLMLLGSAALWFLLFAFSTPAASTPRASCRYLICLLLATPAVLWPLWERMSNGNIQKSYKKWYWKGISLISTLMLLVLCIISIVGTVQIFADMPETQRIYNQRETLVSVLLQHGLTHIYSNYDTCNVLIFQSHEHILCSVLDDNLLPGNDRYLPYHIAVSATLHPAYVFPLNSAAIQKLIQKSAFLDTHFYSMMVGNYVIYLL